MDVDILAVTPTPTLVASTLTPGEKMYYCQRCLNHNEFHPRKGHKPYCTFSNCSCSNCSMVETRRQLNNKLKGPGGNKGGDKRLPGEKKERTPNCARCSAHGIQAALRGHKKTNCSFYMCECEKCQLVVSRRAVMARQIKLRRNQQRVRLLGEGRQSIDSNTDSSSSESARSPSPEDGIITISPSMPLIQPMPMRPLPMPIMPRLPPQVTFNRMPSMSSMFLSNLANLNHFLQSNPAMVDMFFSFFQTHQQQ